MDPIVAILRLAVALSREGYLDEALQLRRVCHFIPEDKPGIPSFWRRNYDYGEGFYHGDMSKKEPLSRWRKKHKKKGPNFPKKKKRNM